jgi:4-hydroxy-3-methylbut-2-en-1-yl diphosphate reductase
MKVIRASAMGFCFGVRDALEATERIETPGAVTIHGELVHNERVLVQLAALGFQMSPENDRRRLPKTDDVLITAHGISDAERRRLEQAGKRLIDTTCPLVERVHRIARKLASEGYHMLVIGRPNHVEVAGIIEDLNSYDVVATPDDVQRYPHDRLGIVCQTTTPPRTAERVIATIRQQNPHAEIRSVDTICQPTRDRQTAIDELIRQVQAVVVVGGRNSNNTRELVALCRERGLRAWHVQTADELDPAWFTGCEAVGLTAGTSTLDSTIEDVYDALMRLSPPTSAERLEV